MELAVRKGTDVFVPAGAYRAAGSPPAPARRRAGRDARRRPVLLRPQHAAAAVRPLRQAASSRPGPGPSPAPCTRPASPARGPSSSSGTPTSAPARPASTAGPSSCSWSPPCRCTPRRAYEAIRDAWTMGDDRPLIIAGGPKAVYEPYHYWPLPAPHGPGRPRRRRHRRGVRPARPAQRRWCSTAAAASTMRRGVRARPARRRPWTPCPAWSTCDPRGDARKTRCWSTPACSGWCSTSTSCRTRSIGLSLMEPPHRGAGLSPQPLPDERVRQHAMHRQPADHAGLQVQLLVLPHPGLQPEDLAVPQPRGAGPRSSARVRERFGIKYFFGTDDNFFNRRQTAEEIFDGAGPGHDRAAGRSGSRSAGAPRRRSSTPSRTATCCRWPRTAGLYGIWFGIEDLTAELINKGQKPEVTIELFRLLHQHKHLPDGDDDVPRRPAVLHAGTRSTAWPTRSSSCGKAGAVSVQCTVHTPAVGTREYEKTYADRQGAQGLGELRDPRVEVRRQPCHRDRQPSRLAAAAQAAGRLRDVLQPLKWVKGRPGGRRARSC